MALKTSVDTVAFQTGSHAELSDTSLEDVFIQLMGEAQDNMQ